MMQWFRSHHGAPYDSKLAVVARRANVTRGHAASIWWAVLDHASQHEERGSVEDLDPEEIAAAFEYDEDDVARVIDAMRHKGLLIGEDNRLTGWNKRQVQREDAGATERKKKQRSLEKEEGHDTSRTVTHLHAPEESRVEEIREESTPVGGSGEPSEDESLEAKTYRRGKEVLGKKSGGLITKLRRHCENDLLSVLDIIDQAEEKSDPLEWIGGVLKNTEQPRTPEHVTYPPETYRNVL